LFTQPQTDTANLRLSALFELFKVFQGHLPTFINFLFFIGAFYDLEISIILIKKRERVGNWNSRLSSSSTIKIPSRNGLHLLGHDGVNWTKHTLACFRHSFSPVTTVYAWLNSSPLVNFSRIRVTCVVRLILFIVERSNWWIEEGGGLVTDLTYRINIFSI